jgi:hypothetical protein
MALTLAYATELGVFFLLREYLEDRSRGFLGAWLVLSQILLPIILVLSLRRWAGQAWSLSDLGIRLPPKQAWFEALWLGCFHTTYILAVLLLTAKFHYYYLLDFLDRYNRAVTGARTNYEIFLAGILTSALGNIAWNGEIFCRGYVQGLGSKRMNPNAGALASWLTFGAIYGLEAITLGYDYWPHVWIWACVACFPGPLFESFYLRYQSLLPLIAVRFAGGFLPFALAAFFWYWYPDRSFAVSMPFLWGGMALLIFMTVFGFQRVSSLWLTAAQILRSGWRQGFLPALGVVAMMWISIAGHSLPIKGMIVLSALACVRLVKEGQRGNGADNKSQITDHR